MSASKTVPSRLLMATALLWFIGCGGKPGFEGDAAEATKRSQLAEIHDLVFSYAKKHNQQGPKKLADLTPYEKINPSGVRALKDKSITLVYGVAPDEDSNAVLAYETAAEKDGGLVLLANGTVKKMSADQVKSASKDKS